MRGIRNVTCVITAGLLLAAAGQRVSADLKQGSGIAVDEQKLLSALDTSHALTDLKRLTEDVIKTPSGVGNASIVSGSVEEAAMAGPRCGRALTAQHSPGEIEAPGSSLK